MINVDEAKSWLATYWVGTLNDRGEKDINKRLFDANEVSFIMAVYANAKLDELSND